MMTVLGEFGRHGGRDVVTVVLVRGHSAEIRALWRALDDADAPEQDRIFARLKKLGAVRSPAMDAAIAAELAADDEAGITDTERRPWGMTM